MAANLLILKIITGEEVMAEVISEPNATSQEYTIKNPVRVVVMPSKNTNSPTVGFAPWVEWTDEKVFTIHKAHVIVPMKPVQEFINQYNTMFGGIVAPSSKLILPGM
jgi:hypothetical protein